MTLYVVPVPIGNLKDITLRAIEILQKVDFIITEDTRYSIKLLNHLGIKKKCESYYRPKESLKVEKLVNRLLTRDAALITDSGTPLISDPGYILIRRAIEKGIHIVSLPGPTAFVPVLVASGINPALFCFLGFPPRRNGHLARFLKKVAEFECALVFYESRRRLENFLRVAFSVFGNRRFCIGKEISKKNEKIIRAELKDLDRVLRSETLLGEMVVVIEGLRESKRPDRTPEINSLDDIFIYFKEKYGISKNTIKRAMMKK
ncbi:MAG: 16S rRNA (cytidine(1402)-2'-O)-methyltransferase [Candidatus Aminicenantes bacterium]|nr:16S rRNA (cytidine(1402)-2'-O)-methyltransferase [Candidatus Aminicenantes bacterium]